MDILQKRVRTQFSKGHEQKSPARSAGLFIWRRAKLACQSRQIERTGERSEPGLFLLVSPLVGRMGSMKVIQSWAQIKIKRKSAENKQVSGYYHLTNTCPVPETPQFCK
jgi:hypothetical protein